MAKKQAVQERNIRESAFGISKQIDINFRNYALYVLEHRGIPSFFDALTNVQRVSLMNAPKTYSKTIKVYCYYAYWQQYCYGSLWFFYGRFIDALVQ